MARLFCAPVGARDESHQLVVLFVRNLEFEPGRGVFVPDVELAVIGHRDRCLPVVVNVSKCGPSVLFVLSRCQAMNFRKLIPVGRRENF
jgi:hypothetical protein